MATEPVQTLLRRFDGGCSDCSARADLVNLGGCEFALVVRHDPSCPAYADVVRRRGA